MSMQPLQSGIQPMGQFDFLDTQLTSVKGGELGAWGSVARNQFVAGADLSAADAVLDGYVLEAGVGFRPALRIANGATETNKAFYLLDDGTTGYGTLFGQVIGLTVGKTFHGANIGPSTAAASGKVTAWDKPGLYSVTLDNVSATVSSPGSVILPGNTLYREANTGLLTSADTTGDAVAVFIEYSNNGSVVTTPGVLVGAAEQFDRMVIQFLGA